MIDAILRELVKISSIKPLVYSTKRIHILYEGEISEMELINEYIAFFQSHSEIFSFLNIHIMNSPTTSYDYISAILDSKQYIDITGNLVYITKVDYIVYLMDLDICYDYRNGLNLDNTVRVTNAKRDLNNFISELNNNYNSFKFYISPSFPSIEYAIALGLDRNINNINCLLSINKSDIFNYYTSRLGRPISKKTKSFKKLFYESNIFEIKTMYNNSIIDKKNKNLPIDGDDLVTHLKSNAVESLLIPKNPFTYFDEIFNISKTIIIDSQKEH